MKCAICDHPSGVSIDLMLVTFSTPRSVQEQYGVTNADVLDHVKNHLVHPIGDLLIEEVWGQHGGVPSEIARTVMGGLRGMATVNFRRPSRRKATTAVTFQQSSGTSSPTATLPRSEVDRLLAMTAIGRATLRDRADHERRGHGG